MLSRFEQFTTSISAISRYIQKIERDEMEKYGLKGAYAQYLLAIERYPDGITASELSEICDKDKAAVSRAVNDLEKKGLLIRESENEKKYRALLKLTQAGHEAATFVKERAVLAVEMAGDGLSEHDRKILYLSLQKISRKIQMISKEGIPE